MNQLDLLRPELPEKKVTQTSRVKPKAMKSLSCAMKLPGCSHSRAAPGLDAIYCSDCGRTINAETAEYKEFLENWRGLK